jgi:hypothetical protein
MDSLKQRAERYYAPLKRFEIDLKVEGQPQVNKGILFLYEMNEMGAAFFSDGKVAIGSPVVLVVHAPNTIYLKGHVTRCVPILVPKKILHKQELNFRIGMRFEFDDAISQAEFQSHCRRYRRAIQSRSY